MPFPQGRLALMRAAVYAAGQRGAYGLIMEDEPENGPKQRETLQESTQRAIALAQQTIAETRQVIEESRRLVAESKRLPVAQEPSEAAPEGQTR